MRIEKQNQLIEKVTSSNIVKHTTQHQESKQPEYTTKNAQNPQSDEQKLSKDKLQQAVDSVNELFEISHNTSKFVMHEGLDRYYVQLIDKESKEVVKEIPPKKLLDAFYEMQKLVGMVVDEKI